MAMPSTLKGSMLFWKKPITSLAASASPWRAGPNESTTINPTACSLHVSRATVKASPAGWPRRSCRADPREAYRVPDHDTVGKHAWPALLSRARSPCKAQGSSPPRVLTTPRCLQQSPRPGREQADSWPHLRHRRATSRRREHDVLQEVATRSRHLHLCKPHRFYLPSPSLLLI